MSDAMLDKMRVLSEFGSMSDAEYSVCLTSDVIPELLESRCEITEVELLKYIKSEPARVSFNEFKFELLFSLMR